MLLADLRAQIVNCTQKRTTELTHTGGLIDDSAGIMRTQGVHVDVIHAFDHDISCSSTRMRISSATATAGCVSFICTAA